MNEAALNRRPHLPETELEAGSYHLSSHDLRRGLDVNALPLNAVDSDLLHEFLRLRRLWTGASLPASR